ncbi:MAG: peptidoglycan editing factor PgeF [Lachnospiraceae bacterium]|nr:peptidoglycan editing factor PgeF [Robinsoniella sp.]MDY3767088.1 peptidoglycan editing factor PgeF [Lachnospiraceae bacterium]
MAGQISWKRKGNREVMQERQSAQVPYLVFPALEKIPGIVHGFSTRLGGVSEGDLFSMNFSFSREKSRENVTENFRRMGEAVGFSIGQLVLSDQTHTTNVRVVTREDIGKGILRERDYQDVDGMITDEPGIVLATFFADCVPLFFVDPVRKAIGLSHSGWRGTVNKMGLVTVKKMQENFGCDPENIIAAIGPSICQDCYEVSEDVIDQFRKNFEESCQDQLYYRKANGKYQLNLWRANELILQEAGITKEHISTTDLCTCCNSELLYSHRASEGKRGNLGAFLGMAEE